MPRGLLWHHLVEVIYPQYYCVIKPTFMCNATTLNYDTICNSLTQNVTHLFTHLLTHSLKQTINQSMTLSNNHLSNQTHGVKRPEMDHECKFCGKEIETRLFAEMLKKVFAKRSIKVYLKTYINWKKTLNSLAKQKRNVGPLRKYFQGWPASHTATRWNV